MIDIISFLRNYYGISNIMLTFNNLTHDDLEILFPFVKKTKKNNVAREDIVCGDILGVYDKTGKIIYYVNPHITINEDMEIYDNFNEETISINIINADNLSKDELLKLRKRVRILGLQKESNYLTQLIHTKKQEEPKIYRKEKELLKIKEREND